MNTTRNKTIIAALASLSFCFNAYAEEDHTGHNHAKGDHSHGEKGHQHAKKVAGPNGGRIIAEVSPHAEFFVTKERKIQISFLDKKNQVIPVNNQKITLVCGDRTSPTRLKFKKSTDGKSFISTEKLPKGNNIPTIITFKMAPDAKKIRAKLTLNLDQYPTCKHKEYARTCAH